MTGAGKDAAECKDMNGGMDMDEGMDTDEEMNANEKMNAGAGTYVAAEFAALCDYGLGWGRGFPEIAGGCARRFGGLSRDEAVACAALLGRRSGRWRDADVLEAESDRMNAAARGRGVRMPKVRIARWAGTSPVDPACHENAADIIKHADWMLEGVWEGGIPWTKGETVRL